MSSKKSLKRKIGPRAYSIEEDPVFLTMASECFVSKPCNDMTSFAKEVDRVQSIGNEETDRVKSQDMCSYLDCRRKGKAECIHRMCISCCLDKQSDKITYCPGHSAAKMKRLEEDRLIDVGILSTKKRKFYHFEEKFTSSSETALIWCFKDFCRTKKYSEDMMAHLLRQERQKISIQNRAAAASAARITKNAKNS